MHGSNVETSSLEVRIPYAILLKFCHKSRLLSEVFRTLKKSSHGFDSSLLELFWPL